MNAPTRQVSKSAVIAALDAWIRQRPGLEFGNYGDMKSYRAEIRQIGKDLQDARTLLRAVELRDSITGEQIIEAAKHAYSGRLSITPRDDGKIVINYCTGQYWPTEYRRAVCAVLASVLWAYWRDNMPQPVGYRVDRTIRETWKTTTIPGRWETREEAQECADLINAKDPHMACVYEVYNGNVSASDLVTQHGSTRIRPLHRGEMVQLGRDRPFRKLHRGSNNWTFSSVLLPPLQSGIT